MPQENFMYQEKFVYQHSCINDTTKFIGKKEKKVSL